MPDRTDSDKRAESNVPRAALLGLCAGLLLGGLVLGASGLRTRFSPPDCTGLSELECTLIRGSAAEVSRIQVLIGGCLVALGAALGVLLRPRPASR